MPQLQVPLASNRTLTIKYVSRVVPPAYPREPLEEKDYYVRRLPVWGTPDYYFMTFCKYHDPLGSVYFLRGTREAAVTAVVEHVRAEHPEKLLVDC